MSEKNKEKIDTYMAYEKLVVKMDGVQRKLVEMASALNDIDSTFKTVLAGYDAQIKELQEVNKTVTDLNSKVVENNFKLADLTSVLIGKIETPIKRVEPENPDQKYAVLREDLAKYMVFGEGFVKPEGYLSKDVWTETNNILRSQNYKWSSNGKQGAWRKQ